MDKLLSVDEVAEMLGVTKATIYSWTYRNKIPHIKLSKRLLKFRERDIIDWIAEKAVSADHTTTSRKSNNGGRTKRSSCLRDDDIERLVRNAKEEILHGR
jgi:excisionase family DNA binding protein